MLQHFAITRLGIGIHHEDWYRSALGLFEAVTFPSLCAQTCSEFTSLLIVDHEMPARAKSRLESIIAGHRNFHLVAIDLTAMQRVQQGCFDYVWDRCREYLLAERIVVDPFDYIITSVLDGDDAWHRETVALVHDRVNAAMPDFLASEQQSITWIRHTGGMCLTFSDGLQWFAHPDVVVPMHYPFLSMSVFVAARFSSGVSACSSRHSQWPSYCNVVNLKPIVCEPGRPMWTYVRHDRTEVPWDVEEKTSDSLSVDALRADFGIDFAKVAVWRAEHESRAIAAGQAPLRNHVGMPGTEQLDCYFRITALNQQISILERQAQQAGGADPLLARQRLTREKLLQIFRQQAHSIFR